MAKFDKLLTQGDAGKEKIDLGRGLLALGMAILDPGISTAGIEPTVKQFLDKHDEYVRRKENGLEAHLNQYTSAIRSLDKKMDVQELRQKEIKDEGDQLMAAQASIVTPETAMKPSDCVQEVSATFEGDPEAAKLYEGRDQPRKPGEVLPGNTFTQFEQPGIKLAFEGAHMGSFKLSAEEATLLENLF